MKKAVVVFTLCIIFIFSFSCVACAKDDVIGTITDSQKAELYGSISEEVREMLEELGIDDIGFDDIFNVTPQKVFSLFKKLVTGQIEAPTRSVVRLLAIIVLLSVCECFSPNDEKLKSVLQILGVLFCTVSVAKPLSNAVSSAVASITVSEKFMLTLIPVLACVISLTGNPTLAVSFQSIAFACAQIIASVSSSCISPAVGAILALDITGAIMPSFNMDSVTSLLKKTLTAVLSTAATVYVAFLGLKGALSNATDTVASRGIKLAISSAVPVVGGALSEAYTGIVGSLVLARSTVGIFGIAVIALINLPSCLQLVFWIFALRLSAAVGELFNQETTAKLLRAIASAITLLNVVLLFNAVLFIISTALILIIKAG